MSLYPEDITDTLSRITRERNALYEALGIGWDAISPPTITEAYRLLLDVLAGVVANAPLRRGDRVRLIKAPVIDEQNSPGWRGFKHFLVEGALGTVAFVRFRGHGYEAYIEFDDESWIGEKGVINPIAPERRSHFRFAADALEKAPTVTWVDGPEPESEEEP